MLSLRHGLPTACLLCWAALAAGRAGDVDLPAPIQVAPMASLLKVNGVPLAVAVLHSTRPPEATAALIASYWRHGASGPLPVRAVEGPWQLVSRPRGLRLQTVQLRSDGQGGSSGYYAELDAAAGVGSLPRPALGLPATARLVSVDQSGDAAGGAEQFSYWLPLAPDLAWRLLGQIADRDHWQRVEVADSARAGARAGQPRAGVLDLRRGPIDLQLIVAAARGGSSVVINQRHGGVGP